MDDSATVLPTIESNTGLDQILEKTLPSPVADQVPEENYDVVRQHYEILKCHVKALEVSNFEFSSFFYLLIRLFLFYLIFRTKLGLANLTAIMKIRIFVEELGQVHSKSKISMKRLWKNPISCCSSGRQLNS